MHFIHIFLIIFLISIVENKNCLHQVSIRLKNTSFRGGPICVGTLIKEDVVVAAAHCFKRFIEFGKEFDFVAGVQNRNQTDENVLVLEAKYIKIHRHYSATIPPKNDIAIVKLKTKVPRNHSTICWIDLATTIKPYSKCQDIGWPTNSTLQQINVSYIPSSHCNMLFRRAKIPPEIFCTTKLQGDSACIGRSKGTLICDNKLAGVISWSDPDCENSLPYLVTDATFYSNWIKSGSVTVMAGIKIQLLLLLLFLLKLT